MIRAAAKHRCAQNGFVEVALENGKRGSRGLHLRVCDGPLLFGRAGHRRGMVGFRLGDVGLCARNVVHGLIERLLRGGIAAREVRRAIEL
jgi:hypothetical protein